MSDDDSLCSAVCHSPRSIHLHHMSLSNQEYRRTENQKDWASGQTVSALSDEG